MATIRNIMIGALFLLFTGLCSCTKYNYIDGGLANGVHDCTMWEYFRKDPGNWDSTMLMIEHAGLRPLFDGTGEYGQITFFGLTNMSIIRSMMDHNKGLKETSPNYWHKVTDIDPAKCREWLERLVVPQRLMLKNIPRGYRVQQNVDGVTKWQQIDGHTFSAVRGKLFVWTQQEDYAGIPNAGETSLWIVSGNQPNTSNQRVASTDIQTTNGVVMSMNNDYKFTNI